MSTTEEYTVRPYHPTDRAAVIELHKGFMHRNDAYNERYLAWKYEQNPYLRQPLLALVHTGSELVAMRGLYGTKWIDPDGKDHMIPAADDLMIDPAHRNRGLFLLIDKELKRIAKKSGFSSIISMTGTTQTRKLQEVTGWHRVMNFETVTSSGTPNALVTRVVRKARLVVVGGGGPRSVLPTEKKVDRILNHLHNPENKVSAEKSPNIELMVQLSRTPDSKWAQARTDEFYRWRIMNPARRYIALWWKDPRPLGFVLLAVAAEGDQSRIVASGAEDASIVGKLIVAAQRSTGDPLELVPSALPTKLVPQIQAMGFSQGRQTAIYAWAASPTELGAAPGNNNLQVDLIDTMVG